MFTSILLSLLPDVFKSFLGELSGTAIKYIVIFIALISFGGIVWYYTDANAQKELVLIRLQEANKVFAETEKALHDAISAQAAAYIAKQEEFNDAVRTKIELADKIMQIAEERKHEQSVFTKEKGRYERLLQDRGDRIIKLSNIASKRMRDKWIRETRKIDNSLQEGTRSLFTLTERETSNTQ